MEDLLAFRVVLSLGRGLHPLVESNVYVLDMSFEPRVDQSHFESVEDDVVSLHHQAGFDLGRLLVAAGKVLVSLERIWIFFVSILWEREMNLPAESFF